MGMKFMAGLSLSGNRFQKPMEILANFITFPVNFWPGRCLGSGGKSSRAAEKGGEHGEAAGDGYGSRAFKS